MRTGTTLKRITAHHGRKRLFQCDQCRSVACAGIGELLLPELQELNTKRMAHVRGVVSDLTLGKLDLAALVDRFRRLTAAEDPLDLRAC